MTEQTPMTEERLSLIEQNFKYYPTVFTRLDYEYGHELVDEIRRLREENERLNSTLNSHEPDGRNYTNQQYVDLLNQQQKLIEALEWIRDAGTDYQSNKKARNALKEIET